MEQLMSYNETDAAAFVHQSLSDELQSTYSVDHITHILDLVYSYYESIEEEMEADPSMTVDIAAMNGFINSELKKSGLRELENIELENILVADNEYMDSIGIDDDNIVNLDELIDELYPKLPEALQKKYSEDEVYSILCFEADYHESNDEIDGDEMCSYVLENAKNEGIEIDLETLTTILSIESELLGE